MEVCSCGRRTCLQILLCYVVDARCIIIYDVEKVAFDGIGCMKQVKPRGYERSSEQVPHRIFTATRGQTVLTTCTLSRRHVYQQNIRDETPGEQRSDLAFSKNVFFACANATDTLVSGKTVHQVGHTDELFLKLVVIIRLTLNSPAKLKMWLSNTRSRD